MRNFTTHARLETRGLAVEAAFTVADDSHAGKGHQTWWHGVEAAITKLGFRFEDDPTDTTGDSFTVTVPDATRGQMIEALATMPEEAFGWFVLAARSSAMTQGATAQIWPDGIGGFMPESRAAIEALRDAVAAYLEAK
jgi:hypothetical protein